MKGDTYPLTLIYLVVILYLFVAVETRRILNPHPFKYHLNNEALCANLPNTLIWIHSAPTHYQHRMFVRDTWANPAHFRKRRVRLAFFLGISKDKRVQTMIEYESDVYHDIVQETFIDSYRNLTYKAIAGCKWTSTFCKSAELILKADDDMVVDIYLLFRHIDSLQLTGKVVSNTILCDVWYRRYVERKAGQWNVSLAEYGDNYYPPYCPGLGVVMTGDIVPRLFEESLYEPFFWVDDVYFTGILAKTINVTFEQLAATVHFGSSHMIRDETNFLNEYQWMFYHIHERLIARMMWSMIYKRELTRISQGLVPSA